MEILHVQDIRSQTPKLMGQDAQWQSCPRQDSGTEIGLYETRGGSRQRTERRSSVLDRPLELQRRAIDDEFLGVAAVRRQVARVVVGGSEAGVEQAAQLSSVRQRGGRVAPIVLAQKLEIVGIDNRDLHLGATRYVRDASKPAMSTSLRMERLHQRVPA